MAEQDKGQGLLWLFRKAKPAPETQATLDPESSLYGLFKNSHNPFVRRAVAGQPPRTAKELGGLERFLSDPVLYRAGPANRAIPYRRRSLRHPAPPKEHQPQFQQAQRLPGDPQHLPLLVDDFFRSVRSRLKDDPQAFQQVVQELVRLLQGSGIALRVYEAYESLQDWNDLMETLEEIARYPSVETFDLFCSALLAYYDLVYPPS